MDLQYIAPVCASCTDDYIWVTYAGHFFPCSYCTTWRKHANNYSDIKNNTYKFNIIGKWPKVLHMKTIRKRFGLLRMLCWIWVSGCVLLFWQMLTVSLLLVFKLLNSRGIWLHVSFQFSSAPHSSISTVCSAHVYSQHDGSTGQKAAWSIEKTPGPQRPLLARRSRPTCTETHICATREDVLWLQ